MHIHLTTPIGYMAIMSGSPPAATMLSVDAISMQSLAINVRSGVAVFGLVFGAIDEYGTFHEDPANVDNVCSLVIDRKANPDQAAAFNMLFLDEFGNPKWDYPTEFWESLFTQLAPMAFKQVWGGKFPNMEMSLNDVVIYPV